MPFQYDRLWKLLQKRGISQKELACKVDISTRTLTRMRQNDYVALKIIDAICTELHCTPNDIMEHIPSEREPE